MTKSLLAKNNDPEKQNRYLDIRTEIYNAAFPHPKHMAEYDKIVPGIAQKIMEKAIEQTDHRIKMEEKVLDSNIEREKQGMWLAFTVVITITIAGFTLIYTGKNLPTGITALFLPFFSQGASFFFKKRTESKELQKRKEETDPEAKRQQNQQ